MVNTEELKTILKEIHFYSYWDKKLIDLAIKHGLLAEEPPKREKLLYIIPGKLV